MQPPPYEGCVTKNTSGGRWLIIPFSLQDTRLPSGSFVIVTGMTDGRAFYELMANRYHPLGQFKEDITYNDVYDFLNCLVLSPCKGWLTANETMRNITSEVSWGEGGMGRGKKTSLKKKTLKNHFIEKSFIVGHQLCWKDHLVFICHAVCMYRCMYVCMYR